MAQSTVRLNTSGMHCSSCSMLIDITLSELDGVEASKSDHADGSTVVTFDDEVTTVESIIAAVRSAGYEAEVAP